MNRDEIIEEVAKVLSTLTTCNGQPHATELHHLPASPHGVLDQGSLDPK